MDLTEQNYFTQDVSKQYMSASQLKGFLSCPAQTLAELSGEYKRETSTALLVGSYVDAHFSSTLPQFRAEHPEIYTLKGGLRSEFSQAEDIIAYLSADPLLMRMMGGEKQKIVTGTIQGVQFKGKLDCLLSAEQCHAIAEDYPEMAADLMMAEGAIVDLKCMRSAEAVWVDGRGKLSFVEAFRYDLQCAVYQSLIGGKLPCFLVVVTKEKQPDKLLVKIPQYMLDSALEAVEPLIPQFQAMKDDLALVKPCGRCDFCRSIKQCVGAIDADDLDGAGL